MKAFVFVLLTFFSFIFVNCSNHKRTVCISRQEYDSLKNESSQAQFLKNNLKDAERFISELEENPNFHLFILDAELSATEKGKETYGSFSDYFVPTIHKALEAGASKEEVQKRIRELAGLADRGKFISDHEKELYKEGGVKEIIKYIDLSK